MKYIPNTPVGTHEGAVHRNYGHDERTGRPDPRNGWYTETFDDFSEADRAFGVEARKLRASLGLTLRGAATATGLTVVEISGLERGRGRVEDLDELRRCYETALSPACVLPGAVCAQGYGPCKPETTPWGELPPYCAGES